MRKNIAKLYDEHSIMLKPLVNEVKKNVKKENTIIDLGCGTGVYIKLLQKQVGKNGRVMGIDKDNEMIKFCKKKFKENKIVLKKLSAENLSRLNKKVDVVFSSLVLHFTNIEKSLFEIRKILKSNGKFIFAVPLYRSGIEVFDSKESKKFRSEFVKNLKNEMGKKDIKKKFSLDYANKREKIFKKILQKNKFRILNWKVASLEKANLKVLLEYFKISWRSEKLLPIPFSIRYKILTTILKNTFYK